MNKYITHAVSDYNNATALLERFCAENTDFEITTFSDGYHVRFVLTPREDAMQESMFETNAEGAIGEIEIIYCSGGTSVQFGLKCNMQANVLKKLLNLCAACGEAALHCYKATEAAKYE